LQEMLASIIEKSYCGGQLTHKVQGRNQTWSTCQTYESC